MCCLWWCSVPLLLFVLAAYPLWRSRTQRHHPFHTVGVARRGSLKIIGSRSSTPVLERIVIRPTLSLQACEAAIGAAFRPDASWSTARHDDSPTTDIEVDSDPAFCHFDTFLADVVLDGLFADLAGAYGVEREQLFLRELFVVKYETAGQSELRMHRDSSFFSFVVQLNDPSQFAGGGTTFAHAPHCAPLTVRQGEAILFVGQWRHGAAAVTRGRRLILAGFVDLRERCTPSRPHLTQAHKRTRSPTHSPICTLEQPDLPPQRQPTLT